MRTLGMILLAVLSSAFFVLTFWWPGLDGFSANFEYIFSNDFLGAIWPTFISAFGFIFFLLLGARVAFGSRRRRQRRE
ncbi:MAG: hypothetical protein FWE03_06035 [Firmicutes bacterium]|nr:hypothetical protein [Bacillota bacterium]